MTILIFCGGIGLLGESIFGTSFNRHVEKKYKERKAREEESYKRGRILSQFEKNNCLQYLNCFNRWQRNEFVEKKYSMSISEFDSYARKRLKEIFNNENLKLPDDEYGVKLYETGLTIRIIDDGKLPFIMWGDDWGGSILGYYSESIYYYLGADMTEELAAWAAETMRERGVPISLISGEIWNDSIFKRKPIKCFIDLYEDPIKHAARYNLSGS